MPDPWNKLTTESNTAYEGFSAFRDMGPARTLGAAFRMRTGRERGDAPRSWRLWAKKYSWHDRARAWDVHVAKIGTPEIPPGVLELQNTANDYAAARFQAMQLEMENQILGLLFDRFREMAKHPLTRTRTETSADGKTIVHITEPSGWNERTMIHLARALSTNGRLLRKLPAQVEKVESTPHDFASLLFHNDHEIADVMPAGATPPIPDDVLAKPSIADAAKRGSDPAAGLSQPGVIRPPR